MHFTTLCLLLLSVNLGSTVYIHIEDGLCVDLYDPLNMVGGIPAAIAICGESLEAACGTSGDGALYETNPYDCKNCDTVTIYDGFNFDRSLATEEPTCQGVFTFPEDYGDVYYRDSRLYDAFGNQIGSASCNEAVTWGGKFLNPWNSYKDSTRPSLTPCPPPTAAPPSATCYHAADPDACPQQYDPGWCYCNDEAARYPIQTLGSNPCDYTVLPTTTTTTPVCTATE